MNQDPDLKDALSFLVKRIEGEATRSDKPLTEEEGFLLNNLPTAPLFPLTGSSDPIPANRRWSSRKLSYSYVNGCGGQVTPQRVGARANTKAAIFIGVRARLQ